MWKGAKVFLVVLSVAFNGAFAAMWFAHAVRSRWESAAPGAHPATASEVWCPLYEELGVSADQWREIEPRLKEFQASVDELRRQVNGLRSEVIDLAAAEESDLETIHAKQEQILTTKRKIQRLVIAHLLAEKEVLAPQQQDRLFEMLRNRTGCPGPPMLGRSSGRGIATARQNGAGP